MTLRLPLNGGCICGKLRYSVTDQPLAVLICHCRNCQQRTGSSYSLSMLTWRRDFVVVSGDTLWRDLPGGSGALHRQHICPACFTRTHTEMLAHPDIINLRPGTLDEPTQVSPTAQIWTREAHVWAIAPGVKSFDEDPTNMEALVEAWRGAHRIEVEREASPDPRVF